MSESAEFKASDYLHEYKQLESGRFIAPQVYHCKHCGHLTTKPERHKEEQCPAREAVHSSLISPSLHSSIAELWRDGLIKREDLG